MHKYVQITVYLTMMMMRGVCVCVCTLSVIVSQWTSMLQIVAVHLKKMNLDFSVIDGTVNPKRRMDLVDEFNTNPKKTQVIIFKTCTGLSHLAAVMWT